MSRNGEREDADNGLAGEVELAKAFQELQRGEKTASALESQLTAMEAKIDALLAQAEEDERLLKQQRANGEHNKGQEKDKS